MKTNGNVYVYYGQKYARHQADAGMVDKVINRFKKDGRSVAVLLYPHRDDPASGTMIRIHRYGGKREALLLIGSKGQTTRTGAGLQSFSEKCESGQAIISEE